MPACGCKRTNKSSSTHFLSYQPYLPQDTELHTTVWRSQAKSIQVISGHFQSLQSVSAFASSGTIFVSSQVSMLCSTSGFSHSHPFHLRLVNIPWPLPSQTLYYRKCTTQACLAIMAYNYKLEWHRGIQTCFLFRFYHTTHHIDGFTLLQLQE